MKKFKFKRSDFLKAMEDVDRGHCLGRIQNDRGERCLLGHMLFAKGDDTVPTENGDAKGSWEKLAEYVSEYGFDTEALYAFNDRGETGRWTSITGAPLTPDEVRIFFAFGAAGAFE